MKLSIITINFNNAVGLKKTLDSAVGQTCMDFEHIVVDGSSTDDSVDIIKQYAHVSKWVSEPDTGIYNAMNKGIRMATGEYLLFMNSGDALANEQVIQNFHNTTITADIATGIERMPNDRLIYPPKGEQLTYAFFYEDTLLHQSTFVRRDAFERFGMYNENYRIVSDWEWFFRAIVLDCASYQTLDFVVANFDGEGMSNNLKYRKLQEEERERVHQTILPRVRPDYEELLQKRSEALEFEHLRNGKFGVVVKMFLKLKYLRILQRK